MMPMPRLHLRRATWILLSLAACFLPVASAQQKAAPSGDYKGTLGALHLVLHIQAGANSSFSGTLDSPDQGSNGIPCADFQFDGTSLSFTVPTVHGSWKGTVSPDGSTLTGNWTQGQAMPLEFKRDTFVPAAKPSDVDGIWLGTLAIGTQSLRIQVIVESDVAGKEFCTIDSLDQRAMGNECANVRFAAPNFSFDVPVFKGHWEGTLSADGKSLNGTWSQNNSLPLNLTRQAAAISVPPLPPMSYDAALPPVSAAELQTVLDKDLAEAIKSGELAPSTGAGVSIAVIQHGVRRVFSYGTAHPDSVFEIGSITKTFTGLILAQLVEQGKVRLDEPVRELLPPGTIAKPEGAEITLLDLATQHSGLPRMPSNFHPKDENNPYADYAASDMYAFMKSQGVAKPATAGFLYSNLGFGLLGQALAVRSGLSYPDLLRQQVTEPLDMSYTTVALTAGQMARFMQGHDAEHKPAHAWDLDAMAGAGAIRSTAGEMLTYLAANLHPEALHLQGTSGPASTLAAALQLQHQLRAEAVPGMKIGFAWLWEADSEEYWHNGGTGGFSSYAFFNPKGDYAAIVLINTAPGAAGSFADRLGKHISQRLAGKPAISLKN